MTTWWLDEIAHAGPEHLDANYVSAYDHKAGFDPAEDLDVLRARGVNGDSVVVDLGAGTGGFALAAASVCRRVIAVDISPAMTAALRAQIERLGLDNVTVVQRGFLTYEHLGQPADAVFTRNALHHLPDFWKAIALERIAAMLRPGGILRLRDLVFDFPPDAAVESVEAWMTGAVTDPAAGWTAEELAEHVRTEFSTYSWLLEAILDRTGFDIADRSFQRAVYGAYTCVRR